MFAKLTINVTLDRLRMRLDQLVGAAQQTVKKKS
jgi:hypothetical protein